MNKSSLKMAISCNFRNVLGLKWTKHVLFILGNIFDRKTSQRNIYTYYILYGCLSTIFDIIIYDVYNYNFNYMHCATSLRHHLFLLLNTLLSHNLYIRGNTFHRDYWLKLIVCSHPSYLLFSALTAYKSDSYLLCLRLYKQM